MTTKRLKRPRDPIALAKLIGDIATGQTKDAAEDKRDPAAVALGRRGGIKGGKTRASRLSASERHQSAQKAAQARWAKRKVTEQSEGAASVAPKGRRSRVKLSIPED